MAERTPCVSWKLLLFIIVSVSLVNIKSKHLSSTLIGHVYIGRARDPILSAHHFKQNQNCGLKKHDWILWLKD